MNANSQVPTKTPSTGQMRQSIPPDRVPPIDGINVRCTSCGQKMPAEHLHENGLVLLRIPAHAARNRLECIGQLSPAGLVYCPGCDISTTASMPFDPSTMLLCMPCLTVAASELTPYQEAKLAAHGHRRFYLQYRNPSIPPEDLQ